MADIGVVVTGAQKVALRFDQFPGKLRGRFVERITEITARLASLIRADAPKKTGRLAGEIVEQVYDDRTAVSGRVTVGDEFAKAGALEWGAHGSAKVSGHTARLTHLWGRSIGSPIEVFVSAHSRQLDLMAQRFLRGPLEQLGSQITESLQEVVDDQVAEDEQ